MFKNILEIIIPKAFAAGSNATQDYTDLGAFSPPTKAFAPDIKTAAGAVAPLGTFLSTLFGFITTLAGIFFLVYFILAGLSWIMSGGEKGKIESAKQQMTNAALGLIVIIAAYSIIGIVGGVLGLDILNPGKIIMTLIPAITGK